MELTERERALAEGAEGETTARIMRTLIRYGEAVRAERLVPIEGAGHLSISAPLPGTAVPLPLLEQLVEAGLRTPWPFTLDPHPIPAVCELGGDFLAAVRSGDRIEVGADGAVAIATVDA